MPRAVSVLVFACLALAPLAAPATAGQPPTATQNILYAATSPADLRARLVTYARSVEAADRIGAGEAWHFMGASYARASAPDSAILCWRRALDLRGTHDDRYDLAEALLARQAPGDIDEGVALAASSLADAQGDSPLAATWFQALLAWGKLLAGEREASRALFANIEEAVTRELPWRFRYARAVITGTDTPKAIRLLLPLAVASRGEDEDAMRLLETATQRIQQHDELAARLTDMLKLRDDIEGRVVTRMQGRRIKFAADDGFTLSGVLVEAEGAGRHRPAIVLVAPEDTLADFDSLVVALRGSGLHTLLLNVRGSGWSVGRTCPLPDSWRGREEPLLRRVASDVRDAVRAVSLASRADANGVVLVASRSMVLAGALAASQDKRVRALVLLSPNPDPVDRGVVVATLAGRRIPVFIQQTFEDLLNFEFADLALHAGADGYSRVSDGRSGGHGAIAFRHDRRVTPRFVQWLGEALKAPATPRPGPRKG